MRLITFFTIITFLLSCHTNKKADSGSCDTIGTIRDFSDLDGCGLLIQLPNGDKLNPAEMKVEFPLKDGIKVKFSYKELKDRMSICMSEKAIVEITCIEEYKGNGKNDCTDTMNPFAVSWMNKAIDRHNPTQVLKYKNGSDWAYLFYAIPDSFLYDCRGNQLCQTHGDLSDDCHEKYINSLGRGKIIWQGEGVWD